MQNHKNYTAHPETLGWAINHPCYFWKNLLAWAIYWLYAKYSLKGLNKILWFFSNFMKWFLFENSYPSCWINKYYLNIQNGQITQVIFPSWFEIFAEEQRTHPLVLLFDRHMTHLSMATLKLALKENGSVIRLPAYCTALVQSVDVICLNHLKSEYQKELTKLWRRWSFLIWHPQFGNRLQGR